MEVWDGSDETNGLVGNGRVVDRIALVALDDRSYYRASFKHVTKEPSIPTSSPSPSPSPERDEKEAREAEGKLKLPGQDRKSKRKLKREFSPPLEIFALVLEKLQGDPGLGQSSKLVISEALATIARYRARAEDLMGERPTAPEARASRFESSAEGQGYAGWLRGRGRANDRGPSNED